MPLLEEQYRALEECLRRLKEQAVWAQITKIVLYGSGSRGDAGEESDIDVLLVSTGNLQEAEGCSWRCDRGKVRKQETSWKKRSDS